MLNILGSKRAILAVAAVFVAGGLTTLPAAAQSYGDWSTSIGVNNLNNTTVSRVSRNDNARNRATTPYRNTVRSRSTATTASCGDMASLQSRIGSLSREDYMRYRSCRGLAN
ncbi:hypothetical protein [Caulobacter sp. LARHSG274]